MQGFKEWLLAEMPITNWQMRGDWGRDAKRQYGFNRQDAGILGNPKGVAKIHQKWSNTKQNYEFYFVRESGASKFQQVGQVSSQWVQQNLGFEIEPNEDAITIIFTNNRGAEKIPMTAWMIAHRMGHVMVRNDNFEHYFWDEMQRDMKSILKDVYQINPTIWNGGYGGRDNTKAMLALFYHIGTMTSTQRRNLTTPYEFMFEVFAQYLITGKIRFNPLKPQLLMNTRMNWGKRSNTYAHAKYPNDFEGVNEMLMGYAEKYEHYLDSILTGLVGEIFVM